jgi:hypothetical protein
LATHLVIYTVLGNVPLIVVVDHRCEVDDGVLTAVSFLW